MICFKSDPYSAIILEVLKEDRYLMDQEIVFYKAFGVFFIGDSRWVADMKDMFMYINEPSNDKFKWDFKVINRNLKRENNGFEVHWSHVAKRMFENGWRVFFQSEVSYSSSFICLWNRQEVRRILVFTNNNHGRPPPRFKQPVLVQD